MTVVLSSHTRTGIFFSVGVWHIRCRIAYIYTVNYICNFTYIFAYTFAYTFAYIFAGKVRRKSAGKFICIIAYINACTFAYIYTPIIAYIFAYTIECIFAYIFACIYFYTFRGVEWRISAIDSHLHLIKLARILQSNVYAVANHSQQI